MSDCIDIWINDGAGHYARRRLLPPDVLRALPGLGVEPVLLQGAALPVRAAFGLGPVPRPAGFAPAPVGRLVVTQGPPRAGRRRATADRAPPAAMSA